MGGGPLGENAKTLHFASCTLQPGPFSDIPWTYNTQISFSSKNNFAGNIFVETIALEKNQYFLKKKKKTQNCLKESEKENEKELDDDYYHKNW